MTRYSLHPLLRKLPRLVKNERRMFALTWTAERFVYVIV